MPSPVACITLLGARRVGCSASAFPGVFQEDCSVSIYGRNCLLTILGNQRLTGIQSAKNTYAPGGAQEVVHGGGNPGWLMP